MSNQRRDSVSHPARVNQPQSGISPEALQYRIDQAAYFNMFSIPDPAAPSAPLLSQGDSKRVIGMRVNETLHRFQVITSAPTQTRPLTALNRVGERVGTFTHRWLLIPDEFASLPGREPPPTELDASRSQRFAMLDSLCRFGDGEDGFRGFGTGYTIPPSGNGSRDLQATAIGTILEGFGKFRGCEEGTYLYCGTLTPDRGFMGNVLLRVMDPEKLFETPAKLPEPEIMPDPEPDVTYLVIRGQAIPSDPVTQRVSPDRQVIGLTIQQGVRLIEFDFAASGRGGLRSVQRPGRVIGKMTAAIDYNVAAPPGTNATPVPYTTRDEYVFWQRDGEPALGGFGADSTEGRVFGIRVSGYPGIRFGGLGRVYDGNGCFQGITGVRTDNSLVLLQPHVSASVYTLRLHDPQKKFRSH